MPEDEDPQQLEPTPVPQPPSRRSVVRAHPVLIGALAILLVGGLIYAIQVIATAPEVGSGSSGGAAPPGMPPAAVFVVAVAEAEDHNEAKVTGALHPVSKSEISGREPGAVNEVLVDEGDLVKQGAVLVRIDGRRLAAQLAEAKATMTSAKSLAKQRRAEQERATEDLKMKSGLLERKAVSISDTLDAKQALAVADAQLEVANDAIVEIQSQIDFLNVQRGDLEIIAPFAGVVVERHVEPGEWIAAGGVVVSITSIDPVEAWLRVPARFLSLISEDPSSIRVQLSSSGKIVEPTKVAIVPQVDPRSQLFTVVATIANPDRRLAPGESVTGIVPVGKRVLHWHFPVDALIRTRSGDVVFVADASGGGSLPIARRVAIDVSFERDGQAYVVAATGPFAEGDQVVVEGNERLRPGQPLMVKTRLSEEAPVTDPKP